MNCAGRQTPNEHTLLDFVGGDVLRRAPGHFRGAASYCGSEFVLGGFLDVELTGSNSHQNGSSQFLDIEDFEY